MILSTLKLDEESELEFSLNVFGTAEQTNDVRFVVECADYDISFPGIYENGNVKVKIPKMKGLVESGEHACRMEVIVGDKIFSPLNESLAFEPLVEIDIKTKKVESIKESVTATPIKVTKKTAKINKIEEAMSKGYDIAEYEGHKILKKNGEYHGFVNESKMILSDIPYSTIYELVEAFSAK